MNTFVFHNIIFTIIQELLLDGCLCNRVDGQSVEIETVLIFCPVSVVWFVSVVWIVSVVAVSVVMIVSVVVVVLILGPMMPVEVQVALIRSSSGTMSNILD